MAVLTQQDEQLIHERFEDMLSHCYRIKDEKDRELIIRAFELANEAHKEMKRKSGEPYILHPIAVAKIVSYEIGLGTTSVVASLLHDVVEDTEYTLEYIDTNFGHKIATIVDGLTKISGVFDNNSSLQAENFRKMLLTLSDDVRVIFIKLADRLHNMRTLDSLAPHKQIKISGETIYLYAPLAHRLGLYAVKTELEDLSLKYRHPKIYNEIVNRLHDNEEIRRKQIDEFSRPIAEILHKNNITFEVSGRPKSIYSIYYKMQHKGVPFEEVYDLLAMRIVFDPIDDTPEKTQCWNIYSLITDIYMPKPERIRDWVSTPKTNGYEALHVTVMGPRGKWIEVQIRTRRMDEIAERGFAAHWKYKNMTSQESELDKWLKSIRETLENPHADALEFLDEFKMNLFYSEIHVFTPKGLIKTLPKNATALDFAYEIHSEIGNSAIAAKVNHKLVPLNHVLSSGDQVEIVTSDKKKSQREWFDDVVTAKAKAAIKDSIKAESKNRIESGKQILEKKLSELSLIPSSRIFKKLLPAYEVVSKDELYSKIGSGLVHLEDLTKVLKKNTRSKWIRYWELQLTKVMPRKDENNENVVEEIADIDPKSTFLIRENADGTEANYHLAKCCNPIPGDDIVGHRNAQDNIVIIHKSRCPHAVKLVSAHADLLIQAKWTTYKILSFLARVSIQGIDKFGIYNQITYTISKELNVNMRAINLQSHDGIFEGTMDLYVHNAKDLNNLISNILNIKGVEQVSRIENLPE